MPDENKTDAGSSENLAIGGRGRPLFMFQISKPVPFLLYASSTSMTGGIFPALKAVRHSDLGPDP